MRDLGAKSIWSNIEITVATIQSVHRENNVPLRKKAVELRRRPQNDRKFGHVPTNDPRNFRINEPMNEDQPCRPSFIDEFNRPFRHKNSFPVFFVRQLAMKINP
jgi:hypothetical protein